MDGIGREQRQLERDVDMLEQKRAAEEKRMYDGSIVNQKELQALQHEIASLVERRSRFEDELLARMEQVEALEGEIGSAEGEMAAARGRLDATGQESQDELDSIASELAERRATRETLVPEIDDELLSLYENLRKTKKGVGAAALVDGNCQGCHQTISSVELNKLKHTDAIKRCEHCRRILIVA
jgi:predicted  nucleic acid-binding Zn-ribbon protein